MTYRRQPTNKGIKLKSLNYTLTLVPELQKLRLHLNLETANSMKLEIFTIHDSKADAYIQPFIAANTALARRMFCDAVNRPDTDFYNYTADYTLFHLGSFDQTEGTFTLIEKVSMGNALQFRDENHPTLRAFMDSVREATNTSIKEQQSK